MKKINNNKGFSLIEIMITLLLVSIVSTVIYSLIILSLKITADNASYVEALNIANQKMERIRNLSYADVGTAFGSPAGTIPQIEIINKYTINSYVKYFQDPYDGLVPPADLIFDDYKVATIKVSWEGKFGPKSISVFSKVISRTLEMATGNGLLVITVVDANGQPVQAADVRVVHAINLIDQTLQTDATGILYYSVPESLTQDYVVTVTKAGYGTAHSFNVGSGLTPLHLKVNESDKTEELFEIDKLATLNIVTVSDNMQDNFQVNDTTVNTHKNINISIDNAGNVYYTWQEETINSSQVLVQKFASDKTKQWASDQTLTTSNFQTNPDIATTKSGNSFITWQDNSPTLKLLAKDYSNKKIAKNINPTNYLTNLFIKTKNNLVNLVSNKFSFIKQEANLFKNNLKHKYQTFRNDLKPIKAIAGTGDVTFVGMEGDANDDAYQVTVDKPSGTTQGDFLLAIIYHRDYSAGGINEPSGWNTLESNFHPSGSGSDARGYIYWKIAGPSEPSNYTFSLNNTNWHPFSGSTDRIAGQLRVYRDVDATTPFNSSVEFGETSSGTAVRPCPSHTIASNGSMLICGWSADTWSLCNGGPTFPGDMSNTKTNFDPYICINSADKEVGISDNPSGIKNLNPNNSVARSTIHWSLVLNPASTPDDVIVSSQGTQITTITKPDTDQIGGSFAFTNNSAINIDVTSISLTETGTIDAQNSLSNITLYYDLDTSAPYDCASESMTGIEPSFGSATNFNAPDGIATFNDSIQTTPTKALCIYTVLDVLDIANKNETIEISINNPSTDITANGGASVIPGTPIELLGTTNILSPPELEQIYSRWRNDDGSELMATWKENVNTPTTIKKGTPLRLRLQIVNNGSISSGNINYQLEYGEQVTTCDNIETDSSWQDVTIGNDWKMFNTSEYNEEDLTTDSDIPNSGSNFISGFTKRNTNLTSSLDLDEDDFTEIEFAIEAQNSASDSSYCFRLTNAGATTNFVYSDYPEINIIGDNNIYITYLDTNGNQLWGPTPVKKVNEIPGNEEQANPSIAIAENFGTATTAVAWIDERNGNSDIYLQIFDINGDKQLINDLQITSSSTNEVNPKIAIDSSDNILITWIDNASISKNIYLKKIDLLGITITDTTLIAGTSDDEYNQRITTDQDENFYLTWTQDMSSVENSHIGMYNNTCSRQWLNYINQDSNISFQSNPNIFATSTEIIAVWTDTRDGNKNIYSQKFATDGAKQWTEDLRINAGTDGLIQESPTIAVNSNGDYFAAWEDFRNAASSEIFAVKYTDPGAPVPVPNVDLVITGTKKLSDTPLVLEHDSLYTTNVSGEISVSAEWDDPGYTIVATTTSPYTVYKTDPTLPVKLLPDEIKDIIIYVK